jgi:hypothetical protein
MSKLIVLVEGVTERVFVQQHLAPHLARYGIRAWPIMFGRDGNRGGVREWTAAVRDIEKILAAGHRCTTMFDFYGLPTSWPGRVHAGALHVTDRALHIERAISASIQARRWPSEGALLPYIQLHEFEALHFSDPDKLASVAAPIGRYTRRELCGHFQAIVDGAGGDPEAINDGYETCPSRRILSVVPRFKKVQHGSLVVGRIGLERIRDRCRHFSDWLSDLERCGDSGRSHQHVRGRTSSQTPSR